MQIKGARCWVARQGAYLRVDVGRNDHGGALPVCPARLVVIRLVLDHPALPILEQRLAHLLAPELYADGLQEIGMLHCEHRKVTSEVKGHCRQGKCQASWQGLLPAK